MATKLLFALLIFYVVLQHRAEAQDWDHGHQAEWYDKFRQCSLERQSPIEINSARAARSLSLRPLSLLNYNEACRSISRVTNNGHTVEIALAEECAKPQITGSPFPPGERYEAVSFHFHWGSNDFHGSEHIVNGKRHSMEGHIVHRNLKYPTEEEASRHPDGLAVLAILYEAKDSSTRDYAGLQGVVRSLKSVARFNSTTGIKGVRLTDLLGRSAIRSFYSYEGSLTIPPCSQAVTWIVVPQVVNISHNQLQQFRRLSDGSGDAVSNNYRFLQPIGARNVVFYRSIIQNDEEMQFSNDI